MNLRKHFVSPSGRSGFHWRNKGGNFYPFYLASEANILPVSFCQTCIVFKILVLPSPAFLERPQNHTTLGEASTCRGCEDHIIQSDPIAFSFPYIRQMCLTKLFLLNTCTKCS